ncbi:MAG: hypothetical protein NVSMB9_21960 [Isosphaeraceae bacterium]
MQGTGWGERLRDFYVNDSLMAFAVTAALFALATTPIAFAVLGRLSWFKTRRGRVMQRPEFASIVCGMMLVMGIPAIFMALVVKSQSFDKNRYEFDPNKTWSMLEQGRGYKDLKEADEAVRAEMKRLGEERKNLGNTVKKLDEAMLVLRASAATSPGVAGALPAVLQRLAKVRESVGVEGPQQLMDFTAPPAEIASALSPPTGTVAVLPATSPAPAPTLAPGAGSPKSAPGGPSKAEIEAELAAVPAPQKTIAAMLPMEEIPAGWVVGKSGSKYIETFNADNLFEKIDGRAESFLDYKVKGMAYTFYHPVGDESNEIQVYLFEMGDALKALGKYGTEKPDDAKPLKIGAEGYTAAGSTLFHAGPYYTQIVSTKDDKTFSDFARELGVRIAARQQPPAVTASSNGSPADAKKTAGGSAEAPATPEALFALLPEGPGRAGQSYVALDVFGYSFLSDVFLAEYTEGSASWKGFLRPYASPDEALKVYEKYLAGARQDGAEIREVKAEGADRMVVSSNIGLVDAFFLKGNTLGGAAGATDAKSAEAFARAFVKNLPARVAAIASAP